MTAHGTGFFIQGSSGKVYILTNSHVCQISENGVIYVQTKEMYIQKKKMKPIPRRILKISKTSDLCIVEAIPGITPLKFAKDYIKFEAVSSYGFPKQYGFVPSIKGKILGEKITELLDFLINNEKDMERCSNPKNFIIQIDDYLACGVKIKSIETTLITFGGNSGSPVVNVWGNVVGIIFAASTETNWGILIDLFEIQNFLKKY